jgi:hypothetical protein
LPAATISEALSGESAPVSRRFRRWLTDRGRRPARPLSGAPVSLRLVLVSTGGLVAVGLATGLSVSMVSSYLYSGSSHRLLAGHLTAEAVGMLAFWVGMRVSPHAHRVVVLPTLAVLVVTLGSALVLSGWLGGDRWPRLALGILAAFARHEPPAAAHPAGTSDRPAPVSPFIGQAVGGTLSAGEKAMLNAMSPADRARYALEHRMQSKAEMALLLPQLRSLRHQTEMSVINDIR